ncbi:MAG: hypothetical protein AAF850_05475 [Pseudomonadota bacterium]
MNFEAFVLAPTVVQVHALLALFALFWGGSILLRRKGGGGHKFAGRVWATAMLGVALTSMVLPKPGDVSPIHAFTAITLI